MKVDIEILGSKATFFDTEVCHKEAHSQRCQSFQTSFIKGRATTATTAILSRNARSDND